MERRKKSSFNKNQDVDKNILMTIIFISFSSKFSSGNVWLVPLLLGELWLWTFQRKKCEILSCCQLNLSENVIKSRIWELEIHTLILVMDIEVYFCLSTARDLFSVISTINILLSPGTRRDTTKHNFGKQEISI